MTAPCGGNIEKNKATDRIPKDIVRDKIEPALYELIDEVRRHPYSYEQPLTRDKAVGFYLSRICRLIDEVLPK